VGVSPVWSRGVDLAGWHRRRRSVPVLNYFVQATSKAKFAAKYKLTFPLLADEKFEVAEKYGVWQKKRLYGRTFMGLSRTTYLIGADGRVGRRWDKVKVNGHAEDVLQAVKRL
jgi:thioredoxin-dependent peroxiredoxin